MNILNVKINMYIKYFPFSNPTLENFTMSPQEKRQGIFGKDLDLLPFDLEADALPLELSGLMFFFSEIRAS
jgi:hypothetical protein